MKFAKAELTHVTSTTANLAGITALVFVYMVESHGGELPENIAITSLSEIPNHGQDIRILSGQIKSKGSSWCCRG